MDFIGLHGVKKIVHLTEQGGFVMKADRSIKLNIKLFGPFEARKADIPLAGLHAVVAEFHDLVARAHKLLLLARPA